jgi:hypothetical protein
VKKQEAKRETKTRTGEKSEINETNAVQEDEIPERAARILHPQRAQEVHEEENDVRMVRWSPARACSR